MCPWPPRCRHRCAVCGWRQCDLIVDHDGECICGECAFPPDPAQRPPPNPRPRWPRARSAPPRADADADANASAHPAYSRAHALARALAPEHAFEKAFAAAAAVARPHTDVWAYSKENRLERERQARAHALTTPTPHASAHASAHALARDERADKSMADDHDRATKLLKDVREFFHRLKLVETEFVPPSALRLLTPTSSSRESTPSREGL